MKLDQEMNVLSSCYDLLSKLDDDVKVRVLQWLSSKLNVGQTTVILSSGGEMMASTNGESKPSGGTSSETTEKPAPSESKATGVESYNSFTELYRALKPSSDAEKALAAAVYLSAKRNINEVGSAQVQKELKSIGEKVSNITQAISALVKKKLILQLGKEGDSQQARKKYKITPEAVRIVEETLKKRA